MLIPKWTTIYLNSLLLKITVIFSDIPEAIDPFLLVFMENASSSGGRMAIRWAIGALLIILTVAVYDLSS